MQERLVLPVKYSFPGPRSPEFKRSLKIFDKKRGQIYLFPGLTRSSWSLKLDPLSNLCLYLIYKSPAASGLTPLDGPPYLVQCSFRNCPLHKVSIRLLKNAHLPRFPYPSSLRRTSKYASLFRISGALHLGIFEQPVELSCDHAKNKFVPFQGL
jgi:hypothetical protein